MNLALALGPLSPAWAGWAALAAAALGAIGILLGGLALSRTARRAPAPTAPDPPDLPALVRRLGELERLMPSSLSRTGLVRFDAFPGSGGQLSFALALVDHRGTGALITAITGRDETRVYAKAIEEGQPLLPTSPEEDEALRLALGQPAYRPPEVGRAP